MTTKGYRDCMAIYENDARKAYKELAHLVIQSGIPKDKADALFAFVREYRDSLLLYGKYEGLLWACEANGFTGFAYDGTINRTRVDV